MSTKLELIVGDASGEIINGDVPVRWCITPEMVSKMETDGFVDPHIIIVASSQYAISTSSYLREMSRQVVPITQLMSYVRFTRSGDCNISAWIVDGASGRRAVKKRFTSKDDGDYITNLIFDGAAVSLTGQFEYAEVPVNIPDGVFANKKVRPALDWFVNWAHTGKVQDECQYRQRMLLAFSVKWTFLAFVATVLLSIRSLFVFVTYTSGYSSKFDKNYRQYFFNIFDSPFDYLVAQRIHPIEDQDYAYEYKDKHGTQFLSLFVPFTPLIVSMIYGMSYLISQRIDDAAIMTGLALIFMFKITASIDIVVWFIRLGLRSVDEIIVDQGYETFIKSIKENYNYTNVLVGTLFTVAIIGSILGYMYPTIMVTAISGLLIGWGMSIAGGAIYNRIALGSNNSDYTEIRELLCPTGLDNTVANYDKIPKEHRTLKLWYLDTKNKVCKPMQR